MTNEEIYQILLEIKERLGNIDGKLEGLNSTLATHGEKLKSLEEDVEELKAWRKGMVTLASVVAFIISILTTLIVHFL